MASAMVQPLAGVLVFGGRAGRARRPAAPIRCHRPRAARSSPAACSIAPRAAAAIVVDLCRRSPTFRRQVARLTDADGLTVTVHRLVLPPTSTALWRAQTLITRVGGLVRTADVQVPAGDARMMAELIAHEFEHILEQLDGVDLKRWVGRSGVRRVGADREGSPIETERAHQVGRLVAGEYMAAAAEITAFKVR